MTTSVKKLAARYPKSKLIFQHRRVPNSINLFNQLRVNKLINAKFNFCTLTKDEPDIIMTLTKLCGIDYRPEPMDI